MISLYADEDVDVLIKPLLKAKGFTVYTTLDETMLGKTDREQLEAEDDPRANSCFNSFSVNRVA